MGANVYTHKRRHSNKVCVPRSWPRLFCRRIRGFLLFLASGLRHCNEGGWRECVWFEVNTDSNGSPQILKNETISLAKNLIFIHITASHWSYHFFPLAAFRSPQAYGLVKLVRLLGVQIVIKCGMNSGRKGDIPPHNIRLCVVVFNDAKRMGVKGGRTSTRYLRSATPRSKLLGACNITCGRCTPPPLTTLADQVVTQRPPTRISCNTRENEHKGEFKTPVK